MNQSDTTPNKGGAPTGNLNALKHGLHVRRTLPLSSLGQKYKGIGQAVYRLRNRLETDVRNQNSGQITMAQEDAINLACTWERVAQFAAARLAKDDSTDPVADAKTAAQAAGMRSAAIRKLGLTEGKTADEAAWEEADEDEGEEEPRIEIEEPNEPKGSGRCS